MNKKVGQVAYIEKDNRIRRVIIDEVILDFIDERVVECCYTHCIDDDSIDFNTSNFVFNDVISAERHRRRMKSNYDEFILNRNVPQL